MITMADLLSASSLLIAIVAILFSLWYADIAKALTIIPKNYKEDNVAACVTVTNALVTKALPVALMALSVALIFLPDAFKLTKESLNVYGHLGFTALSTYDAVATAYCFVTLLSVVLASYMIVLAVKLFSLRRRLS